MRNVKNVGPTEKIIRIIAGTTLAAYGLFGASLATAMGLAALLFGMLLISTGLISFCPVLQLLGINSFCEVETD